jgi:hypothetical protein
LYTRCRETPLDVFIDVLVNKHMIRLVHHGKATQCQINEAWEILFTEYCELSGSPQYLKLLNLTREIGALQTKLLTIQLCIRVIGFRNSQKCVATLRRFGYNYKFNPQDPEGYVKDLKAVITKSKSAELALDQALSSYEKMFAESNGNHLTEDHFVTVLVELSKFMGFRINPREITVSEYIAIIKRREREIELLGKKVTKEKAHGYDKNPIPTA